MAPNPGNIARGVAALIGLALVSAMVPAQSTASAVTPPPARTVPAAPAPLYISTEGGAPITSRDDYVNGSMLLDGVTRTIEIRGRGNSTWTWPKKPYKIKLAEDAALLGTEPRDEWVLLANYADRTALRTYLAMSLGAQTGLAFTPRTRFVDVVLNGTPIGLYVLTDQIEQGTERVDLPDKSFLLEVNRRFRDQGERGFWSDHRIPVSFKDPDEPNRVQRASGARGGQPLREGALRQELHRSRRGVRQSHRRRELHRLVPRGGAVQEPGLGLLHERPLHLDAGWRHHHGSAVGLRPERGHEVERRLLARGLLHARARSPLDQPDVRGPRVHASGEGEVGRAAARRSTR